MRAVVIGIAVAGLLTACSSGKSNTSAVSSAPSTVPLVRVQAMDYAFNGGQTVASGRIEFRVVNNGHALHMLSIVRLDSAKTVAALVTALTKNPTAPPAWEADLGGPNAVSPGDSATAYAVLEPGHYAMVCWVPDSTGKYHLVIGMVAPLDVTASTSAAAAELPSDVHVRVADYHLEFSKPLARGHNVVAVDNDGPQEHDVEVLRILPGHTVAQVLDWFDNPSRGQPAAEALGGLSGILKGSHAQFVVDLSPGQYVILCWVPDEKDGKPHFRHGMVHPLTVE